MFFSPGTDRSLGQIDWTELEKEFEFETMKSSWQNRKWKDLLLCIFIALLLFAASGYDVGIDYDLGIRYLIGDYYIKIVSNQSDPDIMKNCTWIGQSITKESGESLKIACDPDCSLIRQDFDSMKPIPIGDIINVEHGKSIAVSCEPECSWLNQGFDVQSGNQTTVSFQYSCFEQDLFWGGFTLSFTALPGVLLLIRLRQSKEVRKSFCKIIFAITASLIFPLTLIIVKIISLFQFGEEWKRVATLVTACECQVESFLQAGLQLYVILSRPDRQVSGIQRMAFYGSLVMIGFGQFKAAFANRTAGKSISEDIKKMAKLTFWSFYMFGMFILGAVYITIFDKILFFVNFGIMAVIMALILTCFKSSCLRQNDINKTKLKFIMLSAALLIGLIDSIICLVLFNMDPDSFGKLRYFETHLSGNIGLGHCIAFTLIIFITCLIAAFKLKRNHFLHTIFELLPYLFLSYLSVIIILKVS